MNLFGQVFNVLKCSAQWKIFVIALFLTSCKLTTCYNFFQLHLSRQRAITNEIYRIMFLIKIRRSADAQCLLRNFMIKNIEATVRRCSWKYVSLKILQYSKKTFVLESLFNEISEIQAFNFIEKQFQHVETFAFEI